MTVIDEFVNQFVHQKKMQIFDKAVHFLHGRFVIFIIHVICLFLSLICAAANFVGPGRQILKHATVLETCLGLGGSFLRSVQKMMPMTGHQKLLFKNSSYELRFRFRPVFSRKEMS